MCSILGRGLLLFYGVKRRQHIFARPRLKVHPTIIVKRGGGGIRQTDRRGQCSTCTRRLQSPVAGLLRAVPCRKPPGSLPVGLPIRELNSCQKE